MSASGQTRDLAGVYGTSASSPISGHDRAEPPLPSCADISSGTIRSPGWRAQARLAEREGQAPWRFSNGPPARSSAARSADRPAWRPSGSCPRRRHVAPLYVADGSRAAITARVTNVRPSSKSGARADIAGGPGNAHNRTHALQPTDCYSITWSARISRVGGIPMPSALAALRLIMSSIFVACCTGRAAGLSPLRIRPA
jgi:hypothetical protein